MEKKPKKPLKDWAKFSTIALQMLIIIFVGNKIGVWLDQKYDSKNYENIITLIAVFLAMFTVIINVIKGQDNNG